jgi:hypothetical protein
MDIVKVYPLDAVYDSPEDVPEDVMLLFYMYILILSGVCYLASLLTFYFCILGKIEQKICWVIKLDC